MSEQIIQKILKFITIKYATLKSKSLTSNKNIDNEENYENDTTETQRYKEETEILKYLLQINSDLMTESFRPFFKVYYDMMLLLPDDYKKYFPFNKHALSNKLQDELDDSIHIKINSLFSKFSEKPDVFKKELKRLTSDDWVLMTLSKASEPFIHMALNIYQCHYEHMDVLIQCVPLPIWFCPWYVNEFDLTPLQSVSRYIWYFNPKSHVTEQKKVHAIISKTLNNNFRFLKIKELKYDYDFDEMNLFNNTAWYLNLKISPDPDYDYIEHVKFKHE